MEVLSCILLCLGIKDELDLLFCSISEICLSIVCPEPVGYISWWLTLCAPLIMNWNCGWVSYRVLKWIIWDVNNSSLKEIFLKSKFIYACSIWARWATWPEENSNCVTPARPSLVYLGMTFSVRAHTAV